MAASVTGDIFAPLRNVIQIESALLRQNRQLENGIFVF